MIFTYNPNFGYSIFEAAVALIALLLIIFFTSNIFFEDEKIEAKRFRRGSAITCLIIYGIIYGIRMLFEILRALVGPGFNPYLEDMLFFAMMVSIFYPLHKPMVKKFNFLREPTKIVNSMYSNFRKFYKIFMIITWAVTGILITIPILNIPMENPDIFNLSILWTVAVVLINILVTTVINRTRPDEKRIAKKIIRNAMHVGALVAFGLWSLQLLIFEVYLNRWLGIQIIKQDIRVLTIVVSGIYSIFFYYSLKTKFQPESSDKSFKRIQELMQSELDTHVRLKGMDASDFILDDRVEPYSPPEGVSFKTMLYFLKKFDKSNASDEEIIFKTSKQSHINLGIILWSIMILVLVISIFLRALTANFFVEIVFLSCFCALFLVIADLLVIFLFDRIKPTHKRTSKNLFQNIIFLGGAISFWLWMIPFLIIYSYLFIWLNDPNIMYLINQIVYSFIMLYVGSRMVKWYAGSVKMWNTSKKKAFRVSLVWFIINFPLRLFLVFNILLAYLSASVDWMTISPGWILVVSDLILVVINIGVGSLLVLKIYKRKFVESLRFAVGVQILLLITTVALKHMTVGNNEGGILGFFEALFVTYTFSIQNVNILVFVAMGVYLISMLVSLRIKYSPPATKDEVKEKFLSAIQSTGGTETQTSFTTDNNVILKVQNLTTYFYTEEGVVKAVEGVSFDIKEGETLGLVGETGCGKSVTALSILKLVRPPGEIRSGSVYFDGEDLHKKSDDEFLRYRGNKITMIFQDPLNSLNPVFKIGDQISEVYKLHLEDELLIDAVKKKTSIYDIARKRSQKLLRDLNIPTPRVIFDRYPHELSGGMRQRVQIAMGLACSPRLLIADEPTTALDVTIQNQILKLMKDLKKKYNTSILFITHDLGIISKMCDRVAVMYSGFIVEYGDIEKLFRTPYHPYARGLIAAVPVVGKKRETLDVIPGTVPNLIYPPSGCRFHPRCEYCFEPCDSEIPRSIEMQTDYYVACHLYDPQYKDLAEISIKKVENPISND
ncbi:MAG: oligopeptide/dipeptide ABC transporter ATP-binding protein [Promethearchaeota archaeon]|jgi:oligopeptide/dipeptide ABC transporter ATP-binding protein